MIIYVKAPKSVMDEIKLEYGLERDDLHAAGFVKQLNFLGPLYIAIKVPDAMYEYGQEQLRREEKKNTRTSTKRRSVRPPHPGRWGTKP